jgi:hypothetical protein
MSTARALQQALRELADHEASLVHPTYRHLERRARLFGLTFLQWGHIGLSLAAAWLLSRLIPLPSPYDVSAAVTIAGIPAAAAVVALDADRDITVIARGLWHWRTVAGTYLPATETTVAVQGYELRDVVTPHPGVTRGSATRLKDRQ